MAAAAAAGAGAGLGPFEDLKTLVVGALEGRGVLARLRAEMRAQVFQAVDEGEKQQGGPGLRGHRGPRLAALLERDGGALALGLVREFLEWAELCVRGPGRHLRRGRAADADRRARPSRPGRRRYTLNVFEPEAQADQGPVPRRELEEECRVAGGPDQPLLLALLQAHLAGGGGGGAPAPVPAPAAGSRADAIRDARPRLVLADDELLGGEFDVEVPAPEETDSPVAPVAAEPKPKPFSVTSSASAFVKDSAEGLPSPAAAAAEKKPTPSALPKRLPDLAARPVRSLAPLGALAPLGQGPLDKAKLPLPSFARPLAEPSSPASPVAEASVPEDLDESLDVEGSELYAPEATFSQVSLGDQQMSLQSLEYQHSALALSDHSGNLEGLEYAGDLVESAERI